MNSFNSFSSLLGIAWDDVRLLTIEERVISIVTDPAVQRFEFPSRTAMERAFNAWCEAGSDRHRHSRDTVSADSHNTLSPSFTIAKASAERVQRLSGPAWRDRCMWRFDEAEMTAPDRLTEEFLTYCPSRQFGYELLTMTWSSTKTPMWQIDCEAFRKVGTPFQLRDVTTQEHETFVREFCRRHGIDLRLEGSTATFLTNEKALSKR